MRKNLCIVLILLICFVTTFSYAENEIDNMDLQTQRDELRDQLDEVSSNLDNVQSDLSENLKQIEKLDLKIENSEGQLQEQESKITKLKESINKIESELNTVSEKYNKQKDLFQKRVVVLYEAGETQYLDIILKSRSLSEFLSSYFVMSELAQMDKDLLDDLGSKKKTIDLAKEKLEKEKKN